MDQETLDLSACEDPNYKSRSTHIKFMQQLFLGIGGATVFGLVGALAIHGAAIALPMVIGLSVLGLGCLYLGSKFLADSVQLDQENQARKIGMMNQLGKAKAVEAQKEVGGAEKNDQGRTNAPVFADAIETSDVSDADQPSWAEKFAPQGTRDMSALAAKAANQNDKEWAAKVMDAKATADAQPDKPQLAAL